MPTSKQEISEKIKTLATELGFTACGIAPANELPDDAQRLRMWLDQGMHAGMQYMENHFDKRIDPKNLVPGAKSVIVVLLNYFPEHQLSEENNLIVSKYAYGRDYHKVMKKKLKRFLEEINVGIHPLEGRAFVDSAPVLERAQAAKAGLGWIGKNANLISPNHGSFVFIGELITDLELVNDNPIPDYCGGCTKCIQACPTGAIVSDRTIDSQKCISYWTIENKEEIDVSLKSKFKDRIFGCDICQDVCPWNRKAKSHNVDDFNAPPNLVSMARNNWLNLSRDQFEILFSGSAVKRTKYEGLLRNINFVTE